MFLACRQQSNKCFLYQCRVSAFVFGGALPVFIPEIAHSPRLNKAQRLPLMGFGQMPKVEMKNGRMVFVAHGRFVYGLRIMFGQCDGGRFVLLLLVENGEISTSGIEPLHLFACKTHVSREGVAHLPNHNPSRNNAPLRVRPMDGTFVPRVARAGSRPRQSCSHSKQQ